MSHANILDPNRSALVVVDAQEGFRNAIPDFALVVSRISVAIRGFRTLGLPIIVTEQYPKGLGPTCEELRLLLPDDLEPIEKTAFSSCGAEVDRILRERGVSQVVLCGLEAHICVSQTAHDLIERGVQVHLLHDAVCSRFQHDKLAGLAKMQIAGAVPSSTEMALFELVRDSRSPHFKDIQALIK